MMEDSLHLLRGLRCASSGRTKDSELAAKQRLRVGCVISLVPCGPMQDLSIMIGVVSIAASSMPPIPSSGPSEPLCPIPPFIQELVWSKDVPSPPEPITNTLRTVFEVVQFLVACAAHPW